MNNQIKYSLAGFCMGVAELIPGISGATVAVIFKIYPNLMTILSHLRFKNLTLNLRSLSKTFQFNVSLPLIFSMLIAVIICSKGINYLLINHEEFFLSSLGFLMILLAIHIINYFKDVFEDKRLAIFLFWINNCFSNFNRIKCNIGLFIFFNTRYFWQCYVGCFRSLWPSYTGCCNAWFWFVDPVCYGLLDLAFAIT